MKPLIAEALGDLDWDAIVYEPAEAYRNVVKRHGVEALTPAHALMAAGASREEILDDFPLLEAGDITAALEYAARQCDHPVLRVA